MSLSASLQEGWNRLWSEEPGQRFRALQEYRERRRESRWSVGRALWVGGGVLLLLGGLAIGWLPGPGGFLSVVGAGMLATEWRPLAKGLDRSELIARRALEALLATWLAGSIATRLVLASCALVLVVAAAWALVAVVLG